MPPLHRQDEHSTGILEDDHLTASAPTLGLYDGDSYLVGVGELFNSPRKQHSWPKEVDLTDDEATTTQEGDEPQNHQATWSASKRRRSSQDSEHAASPASCHRILQSGAYLPESEISEFRRQRKAKRQKRGSWSGKFLQPFSPETSANH